MLRNLPGDIGEVGKDKDELLFWVYLVHTVFDLQARVEEDGVLGLRLNDISNLLEVRIEQTP